MTFTADQAIDAAMTILASCEVVTEDTRAFIQNHPELDPETREVLVEQSACLQIMSRIIARMTDAQLDMLDLLKKIDKTLDEMID
jgi:hypothetical protein